MRKILLVVCSTLLLLVRCFPEGDPASSGSRDEVVTKTQNGEPAVLPDARIVHHGTINKETQSDAQGAFAIDGLSPGIYDIEASAPGLNTTLTVEVKPGTISTVPIELGMATVASDVTVAASDPPAVEESATKVTDTPRVRPSNQLRIRSERYPTENPDYHKANGISALKARDEIQDNFLLLMADHIFEPESARALLQRPLASDEVILAVDPNTDRIFDLDDATKVRRNGEHIVDIGKDIAHSDALDTGMFLCSPALFDRLESATKDGNCSLSDGMRQLARERRLRALEIGEGQWQDLDTPEALAHAEGVFDGYVYHEQKIENVARV